MYTYLLPRVKIPSLLSFQNDRRSFLANSQICKLGTPVVFTRRACHPCCHGKVWECQNRYCLFPIGRRGREYISSFAHKGPEYVFPHQQPTIFFASNLERYIITGTGRIERQKRMSGGTQHKWPAAVRKDIEGAGPYSGGVRPNPYH